jgi:hypothetical protein
MDEARYGRTPRWRVMMLGLPPAILAVVAGGYWTLASWGLLDTARPPALLATIGPIVAGFGVALVYVSIRRR